MTFVDDVKKMAIDVIAAHGLRDEVAQKVAEEIVALIQRVYGGGDVYVHSNAIKARQNQIIEELAGSTVQEVAKKTGVTRQTVYKIARRVRSRGI